MILIILVCETCQGNSYVATPDEIKENDDNLNRPRYIDTFDEETEVDIAKVPAEMKSIFKH